MLFFFFFFNDTATTEIYTLSLHDALPISQAKHRLLSDVVERVREPDRGRGLAFARGRRRDRGDEDELPVRTALRSEEHTSELQSRQYLVCRLLLAKKKNAVYPCLTCSMNH